MDAYSHTSRQTFMACPRKFYLGKVLRFERDRDTAGLRMGKAFADALEAAEKSPAVTLHSAKDEAVKSISRRYKDAIDKALLAGKAYDVDRLELEHTQLLVLVPAYIERYQQSLLNEAIAKGRSFIMTNREVPFDDTVLGQGRLDAIVDVAGRKVGLEDKLLTPGFWREANERQLRINAQVTAYFAAMREAGQPLDEIRYRVTFKPTIKPNRETLTEYAKRLEDRVLHEEGYSFREYTLVRTDAELDAFMARTQSVNRMIHRAKLDLKRHGEAAFPANFGEACTQFGECEFLELCIHGPGTPGYRVKPPRPKLTDIQADTLDALAGAFAPPTVADVAHMSGNPERPTRTALEGLVRMGYAVKLPGLKGRRVVWEITKAGEDRLND